MCASYSFSWAQGIVQEYWTKHGTYPNYVSRILGKSPDFWAVSLAQGRIEWESFKKCVKLAERLGSAKPESTSRGEYSTLVEHNVLQSFIYFVKVTTYELDNKVRPANNRRAQSKQGQLPLQAESQLPHLP